MATLRKLKALVGVYLGVLLVLLTCVCLTPLIIQKGIAVSHRFMIEEETLETLLIATLFGVSFLLLRGFLRALKRYRQAAEHAAEENATLLSRLAEAFKYIGSVNVEIQEIRSILCGIDCHPRSRKEFQRCLDRLATKAMAIAGSDWLVIRVIDGCDGRTVKECTAQRRKGARPPATMGNRDILEGRRIEGIVAIGLQPRNFDLLTVCLLPAPPLAEAERLLVTVVLNQFEMLYRLHRAGCRPHPARLATNEKETHHVHHC